MSWILVGIGGIFGALARVRLGEKLSRKSGAVFPIGTFVINITGAFLLGVISGLGAGSNAYLLFGTGFLGAYTTFSTFMYESLHLFQENKRMNALAYILVSLLLGLSGYFAGFEIGRFLGN